MIILAILVLINLCIICFAFYQVPSSALASTQPSDQPSVDAISQYGSQSDEVTKIQTRLKAWGYFDGPVTGYYGSQTTEAVKAFQQKHGLSATGRRQNARADRPAFLVLRFLRFGLQLRL